MNWRNEGKRRDGGKMYFVVESDTGEQRRCDVLFTVESDAPDPDGVPRTYIAYTDNTLDEDGNTRVYASRMGAGNMLLELEDAEWEIVEHILEELQYGS